MSTILVAVKRVVDFSVKIRVKSDHTGIEPAKMAMNPFDEIALEEALRLREAGHIQDVVAVSIGEESCQETLRAALALGADRAILIKTNPNQAIESCHVAALLARLAEQEKPRLIFLGKQAIDTDNSQTGQMLAGLLNWPQGCFASQIDMQPDAVLVTSEVDGGLSKAALQYPAVITVDLRLNQPRYASLPNIMKAKQKPLHIISVEDLGVDLTPHIETLSITPPPIRQPGMMVGSVEELLQKLRDEAKVLA